MTGEKGFFRWLLAVAAVLALLGHARADVQPGDLITKDNMDKAKEFLIPFTEWQLTNGLQMHIIEYKKIEWPSKYKEATEKYSSQVKLSADGKQLFNWVAGLPFPDIDVNDPLAGYKVMWNQETKPAYTDDTSTEWILELVDARGNLERTLTWDRWRRMFWQGRLYHEPKPVIPHDPPIRYTELFGPALAPQDLRNTGALTIRYVDPDIEDDTYLYLPQLRKVRRVGVANRSDTLWGTDFDLDSIWGFNSKVSGWKMRLIAKKTILAPPHSGKYATRDMWLAQPDTGAGLKAWMPDVNWEKRTVYMVEGIPEFPNYGYSKGIFYVDGEFWSINFTEWFDRRGELWKVWFNVFWYTSRPRPGKVYTEPGTGLEYDMITTPNGMECDIQTLHTSKWDAPSGYREPRHDWYFNGGIDSDNIPDYHTVAHLVEMGR